jgi:hypothetical protein
VSRPPLSCADRSGFLFAHACDRPAVGACGVCGKPICMQHTRTTASGPTCIACLREQQHEDDDRSWDRDHGGSRAHAEDRAEPAASAPEGQFGGGGAGGEWQTDPATAARADDPYFYPGTDRAAHYDADDYAAFDAPKGAGGGEADADETDTGAS